MISRKGVGSEEATAVRSFFFGGGGKGTNYLLFHECQTINFEVEEINMVLVKPTMVKPDGYVRDTKVTFP